MINFTIASIFIFLALIIFFASFSYCLNKIISYKNNLNLDKHLSNLDDLITTMFYNTFNNEIKPAIVIGNKLTNEEDSEIMLDFIDKINIILGDDLKETYHNIFNGAEGFQKYLVIKYTILYDTQYVQKMKDYTQIINLNNEGR